MNLEDEFLHVGELASLLYCLVKVDEVFLDLGVQSVEFAYLAALLPCEGSEDWGAGEDAVLGADAALHLSLVGLHPELKFQQALAYFLPVVPQFLHKLEFPVPVHDVGHFVSHYAVFHVQ